MIDRALKSAVGLPVVLGGLGIGGGGAAMADWPSDPSQNLAIAARASEQVVSKVGSTSDGGCYVGWFDNASGNYDVRLQRIDAAGNLMWGEDGMLVSGHPSMSFIVNWDMMVDSQDHAVLVFSDIRSGGDLDVYAYRVGPNQEQVWGPDGVTISDNADFEPDPKVAETGAGHFAIVWPRLPDEADGKLMMQRVGFDGGLLMAPGGVEIAGEPGEDPGFCDLVASTGGDVIVSWVRDISSFFSPRHIWAQKFSANGTPIWGPTPKVIFDETSIPIAHLPGIQSDGMGGAIFSWHRAAGSHFNCFVQRANAGGSFLFPAGGAVVSTSMAQQRFSPTVSYHEDTGETFVFWDERNLGQSAWGVYGQKFSSSGSRLWGEEGVELVAVGSEPRSFVRSWPVDGGASVFWFESPTSGSPGKRVMGMRVDDVGASMWGSPIEVCSVMSSKDDLEITSDGSGEVVLIWEDERSDGGDVYGQNVNADGTLGAGGCPADFNGDGVVNTLDFLAFLNAFSAGDPSADFNGDGTVNTLDFLAFLNAFNSGC